MKGGLSRTAAAMSSLVVVSAASAWAEVSVTEERDVCIIENAIFRVEVDAAGGGRIRSWVLKESGRDVVAFWEGGREIGGVLDDRAFFTALRYDAGVMRPGPKVGVLRLAASHPSGLSIVKTLTAADDSPVIKVHYEYRNGAQTPATLWVRNFLLPGAQPQTDEHLYWVNGVGVRDGERTEGSPGTRNYYQAEAPEYAGLWDRATGDAVFVYAPGVERFYFWRGSREHPTFEWIYPALPAGQVLHADLVIGTVAGATEAPAWTDLVDKHGGALRRVRVVALAGWVDEAAKFEVTPEERERGYWLSIGRGDGKQRLPDPLELDLPRDDDRYLAVTVNVLKDFEAAVRVDVPDEWRGQVRALRETPGQDRRELLPIPETPVSLKAGAVENIWLRVGSTEKAPGEHRIPLRLALGDGSHPVTIRLRVWPVTVESTRPFHLRGYSGGFMVWTGGYEVEAEKLPRLEAILGAFAEMGGDVLDWNCVWGRIIAHVKLAETGENLLEVTKAAPDRIELANLPRLDFSYYDPWLELAKKYGVTRVETHMPHPENSQLNWRLLDPAVGKGRAEPGTPEARRVTTWFFAEMKRWLESHGCHGFFAKISDEISPERIPSYIETAEVAREAGWRPFTTITGMIARTARHLRTMDPHCDQWQLNFSLKDDFFALLSTPYEVTQERFELSGPWGQYRNGGAEETWAMKVFGAEGSIGVDPNDVEQFELLEDGKALRLKGGSPWGNRERGTVMTAGALHSALYVSPFDGADPKGHRYDLVVTVRRESPTGQPLVSIDPTDEVWFYGGSSKPFRRAYDAGWAYPVMALFHDVRGYGQWAFYHWNATERIMWIDEETHAITVSPVYCGYRDGWRDALLLAQLTRARGREAFDQIVGEQEGALLRVATQSREVYNYRSVANANDPVACNLGRRQALRVLAGRN